jgi:hypothetical protein
LRRDLVQPQLNRRLIKQHPLQIALHRSTH